MRALALAAVLLAACQATETDAQPEPKPDPAPAPDPDSGSAGDAEIDRLRRALVDSERAREELRMELMILRFGQGERDFRGEPFEDRKFVEDVLVRWESVQASLWDLDAEPRRILAELPKVLGARYGKSHVDRERRFEASRALVAALMSRHDAIRKTAIDSLERIYGRTLLYRHDASAKHRAEKHKRWVREIHMQRRLPIEVPEPPHTRDR